MKKIKRNSALERALVCLVVISMIIIAVVVANAFRPSECAKFDTDKSELIYSNGRFTLEVENGKYLDIIKVEDDVAFAYIHAMLQDIDKRVINEMFYIENDSLKLR